MVSLILVFVGWKHQFFGASKMAAADWMANREGGSDWGFSCYANLR
jgi:hypothetical protein